MIATRESRLALWQARHVQQRLQALYPECAVELLGLKTTGDRVIDRPLAEIGGKGLFTKELELALLDSRADLAVHSLKDVPMDLDRAFALAAVLERADPRDALVSARFASLEQLPDGARVGTSSLRRSAQIAEAFPALRVLPLRGNVDTRLAKLDRGDYDAIVLAAAGLKRLGMAGRIRQLLPTSLSLPAPGQGALTIETLAGRPELTDWLAPLAHHPTWLETIAERAVSRSLGGSCRVPLAAYATHEPDGGLRLDAMLAVEGERGLRRAGATEPRPSPDTARALGERVAAALGAHVDH